LLRSGLRINLRRRCAMPSGRRSILLRWWAARFCRQNILWRW
jgi:hypothetical protein